MSVSVTSVRRNPTILAGVTGLALGAILGLSIASAISWMSERVAAPGAASVTAAQPAQVFAALRQHTIREYGVTSLAQVNMFDELRRQSIRENGSALGATTSAIGTTSEQLFQHSLRENAIGPAVVVQESNAFPQLYQHTLRENGGE